MKSRPEKVHSTLLHPTAQLPLIPGCENTVIREDEALKGEGLSLFQRSVIRETNKKKRR